MGRKQKRRDRGSSLGTKLPNITPNAKCKLRLLKLERVKDWLLMEEEFVQNQERLKPQEERNEEDRTKVLTHSFCGQKATYPPERHLWWHASSQSRQCTVIRTFCRWMSCGAVL